MKVTKGRGIQFFKHPVFTVPKSFAVKTFNDGKRQFTKIVGGIANLPNKISKRGKKQ